MLLVFFFFYLYGDHRDLPVLTHSFPTLRSSDLVGRAPERAVGGPGGDGDRAARDRAHDDGRRLQNDDRQRAPDAKTVRSEEHTSELQSLMRISYAVFCLKKKTKLHTKCTAEQKSNINKY